MAKRKPNGTPTAHQQRMQHAAQREGYIQALELECSMREMAVMVALDLLGATLYVTAADHTRLAGKRVDLQKTAEGCAFRLVDEGEPENLVPFPGP